MAKPARKPAQPGCRCIFETAELMPASEDAAWGATIWYFDNPQV